MKIEDLHWNDSILKKIEVNRTDTDKNNTITLDIDWVGSEQGKFIFIDVYKAYFDLNLGIGSPESIWCAYCLPDDDKDVKEVKSNWQKVNPKLSINGYEIHFNTSNSRMKIIAAGFKLEKI